MSGGSFNSRSSLRGSGFCSGEWSIDECRALTIDDTLASPNMDFFDNQRVGDVLMVGLNNNTVVIFDSNGKKVASVISAKIDRLKRCLENQYNFSARIITMNGAQINIHIYCTGEG